LHLYRISQKNIKILESLKEKNKDLIINIYLSNSIPYLVKSTFNYLKDNKNINYLKYIHTHSKYAIIEKENGEKINIFSSVNSNTDGKLEITLTIKDNNLYDEIKKLHDAWRK